jgi:hypothetical protein
MMGVFAEFERAMIQERVAAAERGRTVTRAGSPPPPEITSDMSNRLVPCVEKVIAAAEAELERADAPLTLGAIVVGEDDEEAAKARVLAEHLKLHPEDIGRSIGWEILRIGLGRVLIKSRLVTATRIIVRFGPLCGLKSDISRGPRSAMNGLMHCNKQAVLIGYSITSSARTSSHGGRVKPSVFAVLRLINR